MSKKIGGLHPKKPVAKYNLQGEFLEKYGSISIAQKENNMSNGSIGRVAHRESSYITAGGFMWRFFKEGEDPPMQIESAEELSNARVKVEQLSLDGKEVIARFDSVQQASKETGIPQSSISMALSGRRAKAHNFRWRRVRDKQPTHQEA